MRSSIEQHLDRTSFIIKHLCELYFSSRLFYFAICFAHSAPAVTLPLSGDEGMAEDHGAPEAGNFLLPGPENA